MPKKTSPKKSRTVKKTAAAAPRAVAKKAPKAKGTSVGLKKQFIKSRPVVKITFRLPKAAARGAKSASVVGDFNGWQAGATPMKPMSDGSFTAVVELKAGKEYRFRYLVDGGRWENDWLADSYAPNSFGSEDSIVAC